MRDIHLPYQWQHKEVCRAAQEEAPRPTAEVSDAGALDVDMDTLAEVVLKAKPKEV